MRCGGALAALTDHDEAGPRAGSAGHAGCMEEASVGTAAVELWSLVHRVDLDGDPPIGEDPFESSELGPDCSWRLPERPGLGIRERI